MTTQSNVPAWITAELFEDLLKSNIPGYRKIRTFSAENGTGVGENYATIMLRIKIDVELNDGVVKPVSYMLKLGHQIDEYQEQLKKCDIFEIEILMYKEYVRELSEIYKNVGEDIKFGAECLKLNAPTHYVLLEDLRPYGFKNANRREGLDYEHTQCVLRKLAQWHAASAVRVDTIGPYPKDKTNSNFYLGDQEKLIETNKKIMPTFLKCCKNYKNSASYIGDLINLEPHFTDELYKLNIVDPDEFNVLNHGDCWSNNIMFQYDDNGKVKETYFVDYQMPNYGTVAQDLYYFLISSVKLEDKISKFDEFIKFYHDNLVKHLKLLNYSKKIPTLRDIHISLFKYGLFGYWTANLVMALVLVDPSESATLETFTNDDETAADDFKTQMYSNPRYVKHMEIILPWLHNRGAFEFN